MAAFTSPSLKRPAWRLAGLDRWIAPAGGAIAGIAAAVPVRLVPRDVLEDWVWRSGLPSLMPMAAPPLGATAHAALAVGVGAVAAAVAWSALFLLFGPGGLLAPRPVAEAGVPVLRRADTHPDAPARKPMSAADLGAPLPPPAPPPAVRPIPADLDLPLAAFHPGAVPDVPREPVRPVAPLRPRLALADGERITTVELPRAPAESPAAPSIESLLMRLEQGTRRPLRA